MASLYTYLGAVVLGLHGVVHLLGTAVYLQLAEVAEFEYKTTVLGGAVDVGAAGMAVFGVLWVVASVGFVVGAGALVTGREGWRVLVVGVAVFSLVLTGLDYSVASAGVVVNLGILAAVAASGWL
jgi:hypothetical protein